MGDAHLDILGAPPRILQEKLEELRLSGCNQLISWSKLGCIAYVTPDKTGVESRHIMCNPKDGRWILSEAYPVPHVARIHEGQQIVHISWNTMGTELAVIDVLGRVSFFSVYMSVNVLQCAWGQLTDQEDDLGGLVGFWWLNSEKQHAVYRPAMKDEAMKGFRYPASMQKNLPPYHPAHKTACLGVTRGGTLKFYYHGDQNRYFEVTQELEGCVSVGNLFSHASFSSDKDSTIILAAYTISRKLLVYRISINWNLPLQTNPQQLPLPPANVSLTVKRVKVETMASPTDIPNMDMSKAFLTHLEIIPPTFSGHAQQQYFPTTIMAVYSVMNMSIQSSIVVRWILRETPGSLHPSFDQLGNRRNSVTSPSTAEFELHRIPEDLVIDKVVIGITHLPYCLELKFACIDGSVQTRDRASLKMFAKPSDLNVIPDVIYNIVHAGFDFPPPGLGDLCTGLSLSPNGTVLIKLLPNCEVKMVPMEYQGGSLSPKHAPVNFHTAIVGLAHVHASGCNNMVNNDDVLVILRPLRSDGFNKALISEVHKALSLKMDFTSETPNERLFRNPILQRCLSLQTSIYYEGEDAPMHLGAKLAWIFLHLRIASLGFGTTINTLQRGEELKIESMQPLIGTSRWSMDWIAYVVDDLFQLARAVGDRVNDRNYIRSIALKTNSPVIFALLSSGTRVLTRYSFRCLRQTESTAAAHIQSAQQGTPIDQNQLQVLRSLKTIFDSSPVKLPHFEKMISDVNGTVTAAYHTLTEIERLTCERDIFINNEIPVVLGTAVEKLIRDAQALMRGEVDLAWLYFHDLSWLGLDDDVKSIASRKSRKIDAIRKTEIADRRPLRQCTRCCSVTEDFTHSRQANNWLVTMQRMCFCGSLWMVVKQ
ncbi:mediator complex, subunit Med16 [Kalaharituber pfeilii]|nr:mediator complex, subunit Med16 [Kalaharituber pfeilii]